MTDPQDDATRPISVAELLARNGTIGAPPVGGRRRRRRGNSDSVTVAELTGEIPIISAAPEELVQQAPVTPDVTPHRIADEADEVDEVDDAEVIDAPDEAGVLADDTAVEEDVPADVPDEAGLAEDAGDTGAVVDEADAEAGADDEADDEADLEARDRAADTGTETVTEVPATPEERDYADHLAQRDADPAPLEFTPRTRRPSGFTGGGAEQMSPDPAVDDDVDDDALDLDFTEIASTASDSGDASPSYLRSSTDTLFGGQTVADDLARRGRQPGPEDIDLGDDLGSDTGRGDVRDAAEDDEDGFVDVEAEPESRGTAILRGAWVVAQCILAVAFGAGLFIAFDQLWKWNNIVALVLSVLVILGLVVGVRVVRKTEDIGSTLIAVAVGALVTLGPLALLQSN